MTRRVRGDRAFVRLIKKLPDDVEEETRAQLRLTGQMLLERALARVPVYSGKPRKGLTPGALKDALSYSVPPKQLRLRVGLVGVATNRRIFYGRLVEFGHRIGYAGNTLTRLPPISSIAAHGSVKARLIAARRRSDVRLNGVAPRHFLFTTTRQEIYQPFQKLWSKALRRAAAGASDD